MFYYCVLASSIISHFFHSEGFLNPKNRSALVSFGILSKRVSFGGSEEGKCPVC